jgi:hypothetical protein
MSRTKGFLLRFGEKVIYRAWSEVLLQLWTRFPKCHVNRAGEPCAATSHGSHAVDRRSSCAR